MGILQRINYSDEEQILLTRQRTLQKLVGILGVLLPVMLYVFLYTDTGYGRPLESLSHYYFTRVSGIFVITVSLLAVFLIIYKGKEPIDFLLSTTAGLSALLVVLFPTDNIAPEASGYRCAVTTLRDSDARMHFHYIAASVFLVSLAAIALFIFTKSDQPRPYRTAQKNTRNICYRICGVLMLTALATALLGHLQVIKIPIFGESLTFWMETIAVESFGLAWLIKAEVFFKDK